MARKIELMSGFALPGNRWIAPDTLHLLDELSPEEIQPYVDAGCIRVEETEPEQLSLLEPLEISLTESEDNE